MDKTSRIFNNKIPDKIIRKANKSKNKFIRKFGDDTNGTYHLKPVVNPTLDHINISNLVISNEPLQLEENAIIIGNIRMGFGHYRIAMAIASCANALGYKPYWFDLNSFSSTTGGKMIEHQNKLYSFGSRLSQKSKLFNYFIWEPMNRETFRKINYNAIDQKNTELLTPIYNDLPKDTPFIGTHVWPTQGAIHHGMTNVVNVIPDNWPMGLHLAEGSIHTVQTPFAYLGYKTLWGMAKKQLNSMPSDAIFEVGNYVDHELVDNIVEDTNNRLVRIKDKKPLRVLLPVGGAGAGQRIFESLINYLMPHIETGKIQLILNFGDHLNVYSYLEKCVSKFKENTKKLFNQYDAIQDMVKDFDQCDAGIYAIYHEDIYQAVYSTNILMRISDVLVTKPSELTFYPIPKFFIKRVGGHEAYGAVHSSEMGDGTFECQTNEEIIQMMDKILNEPDILKSFNHQILKLNKMKRYHGGYEAVKLAIKKSEN